MVVSKTQTLIPTNINKFTVIQHSTMSQKNNIDMLIYSYALFLPSTDRAHNPKLFSILQYV